MDFLANLINDDIAQWLDRIVANFSAQQIVHIVLFGFFLLFMSLRLSKPKVFSVSAVILSYFIWRVNSTILPFVREGPFTQVIMWSYLVAELLSISDIIQNDVFELIKTRRKRRLSWITMKDDRQRPPLERSASELSAGAKVDIIIPTYNEGEDLLRKTLLRALAVAYDNKTVNLLDDGDRPSMRALCTELGVRYFRRDDNVGAKAGNMNAALPYLEGDYIAILDADFLAMDNFLASAIPEFDDPKVGCVQFPQIFYNPDASQINSKSYGKIDDEQWFWYSEVLPYRDSLGLATSCGSCSVVRRSALREIGDQFPADTITEDFDMSLRLMEKGYITRYRFEGVALGLAADSTEGFFVQRVRWAMGNIKAWRLSFARGGRMSLASRSLLVEWRVISLPARIITLLAPAMVFLFDIWPMKVDSLTDYLVFVAPFIFAISEKEMRTKRSGARSVFVKISRDAGVAVVLGTMMAAKLISQQANVFRVTPKDKKKGSSTAMLILLAANAFLAAALINAHYRYIYSVDWGDYHLVSAVWLVWNLSLVAYAGIIFFDRPPPRKKDRLTPAEPLTCTLKGLPGGAHLQGHILDLSEGGARIGLPFKLQDIETVELVLPSVTLNARVLDVGHMALDQECFARLEFANNDQAHIDELVRYLYSGHFIPEVLHKVSVRKEIWSSSDYDRFNLAESRSPARVNLPPTPKPELPQSADI